jgi:hypothetical protein
MTFLRWLFDFLAVLAFNVSGVTLFVVAVLLGWHTRLLYRILKLGRLKKPIVIGVRFRKPPAGQPEK